MKNLIKLSALVLVSSLTILACDPPKTTNTEKIDTLSKTSTTKIIDTAKKDTTTKVILTNGDIIVKKK